MRVVRLAGPLSAIFFAVSLSHQAAVAAGEGLYQKALGIEAYLGVVPAEITKGHKPTQPQGPMHGGVPEGGYQYHLVAAVFNANTGERITDATVTAQVSGLGKTGGKQTLDTMPIAGVPSYGGYIVLAGPGVYTIVLTIMRPAASQPISLKFRYERNNQ